MKDLCEDAKHDLVALPTAAHCGKLSVSGSFMRFAGDGLALSSLRVSPDGGLDVRVFETEGKETSGCIMLPCPVQKACLTDLNGQTTGEAEVREGEVHFHVLPYRIAQVHIDL